MSQSTRSFELSKEASEDLSEKQFYIVQMDASGDAEVAESATDLLLGVLQNTPTEGQRANIRFLGTTKVVASAAIAIGALVTATSAGKAVTTTTDGNVIVGQALEAAAADGDIIEIKLMMSTGYWA